MIYTETATPGVWIIEPKVLEDTREHLVETFRQAEFKEHIGKTQFVQDNEPRSSKGVLQGLHYQLAPYFQSKLVRVIKGRVLDVAAGVREGSPTFDKYVAVELPGENKRQLFISQGFARGFHVLSDETIFVYKVGNPYTLAHEWGIRHDNSAVHVDWSITDPESVSLLEKDTRAPLLKDAKLNFKC